MRRVRIRIHKGRVVEPSNLPDEVEGELTLPDEVEGQVPQRQELLEGTNRAYATLKADSKAWREELKERALWEGTLADGLESGDQES